jgi:hypothetical protein
MATTVTAVKTKITDQFSIVGDGGETYEVEEHTRYEVKKVGGVKSETMGRAYLVTVDGRGVLKQDGRAYSIPSLGVKALRADQPVAVAAT